MIFSVGSTILGLVLSFLFGLKPGGTIVLISVGFFLVFRGIGYLRGRRGSGKAGAFAADGDKGAKSGSEGGV